MKVNSEKGTKGNGVSRTGGEEKGNVPVKLNKLKTSSYLIICKFLTINIALCLENDTLVRHYILKYVIKLRQHSLTQRGTPHSSALRFKCTCVVRKVDACVLN